MSLRKQSLSGIIWSFADAVLLKGLFFVSTVFLARILGPTGFGLIGMIAIFIAIGTTLVDSGLSSSLIRDKEVDDEDYSTVFVLNFIISLLIYIIFYISAPLISDFYEQPILKEIVRVYCLIFIISAFSAVHTARLIKRMEFKKLMLLNIPGTLIGIAVSFVMGYKGYGVWSIVFMYLITQFCQSLMLWIFAKWRPALSFSKEKAKYHYNFGYRLMLSGLINTIFDNLYNIVIGKYFTVQSLGYYERARTFNEYPVMVITSVISKVSFPLLAQIQDEKERVSQLYKLLMKLSFFIIAPLMIMAAAVSKPLFILVLGQEWLPAVPFFSILCLGGIFYPIHAFNINVLKVYGRSDLFLKLEIIKKIVIVLCIVSFFWLGLIGIIWSSVLASFIALIINTFYSGEMMDYPPKKQFIDIAPILVITFMMFGIMYFMVSYLEPYSIYVQIILPVVCGSIFYLVINYIFKSQALLFALSIVKNKRI